MDPAFSAYREPLRTVTGSLRDDLVLIGDIIGVSEIAIADHRGSQPSAAELARIAADARVGGMLAGKAGTVLIHVGDGSEGLALLRQVCVQFEVPIGQFLPTHINRSVALLADGAAWANSGGNIDLTTSSSAQLIEAGDIPAAKASANLLTQGVDNSRIGMSSDAQASLPNFATNGKLLGMDIADIGSVLSAVANAFHEHGVAFTDALRTATENPARFWGLSQKGRIEVGRDADLILLDPHTLHVRTTIAAGRVWHWQ